MEKISVCIITNKADELLEKVISSCVSFADEILLGINNVHPSFFDPIKKNFPFVRIIPLDWEGYGRTRNKLAGIAINDWILSLDRDEMADEDLQDYFKNLRIKDSAHVGMIPLKNFIGSTNIKYGTWGKTNQNVKRFYNKKVVAWNESVIHEKLVSNAHITFFKTEGCILHITAPDIDTAIKKNIQYAYDRAAKNKKSTHIILRILKAGFAFIRDYIILGGFMNKKFGLQLALLQARYTFIKYGKYNG